MLGRCGALVSGHKTVPKVTASLTTKPYQEFNFRHKFSLLLMGIMSRCSSAHKAAGLKYVYIDFVRFSKSCRVQFCAMSR